VSSSENKVKLFQEQNIRSHWDADNETWFFSVIDVVAVLTEQQNLQTARKYWNKLKERLKKEGNQTVTNCHQLKMLAADGRMRKTDVADTKQLLRLIQSIPSSKAEPFKQWLAQVGAERIEETEDLELVLNMLAEASTTEISKKQQPQGLEENKQVAQKGGNAAKQARLEIEKQTGEPIVSSGNAKVIGLQSGSDKEDG